MTRDTDIEFVQPNVGNTSAGVQYVVIDRNIDREDELFQLFDYTLNSPPIGGAIGTH